MRKILPVIGVIAAFFLLPFTAAGQTKTVVSATVVDPNGVPYAGGSVATQLVPTGGTPTINKVPVNVQNNPAAIDANGHFTISLWCNTAGGACTPLDQTGTQWQFTITNPGAQPPVGFGGVSFTVNVTITGTTQDISSTLNAAAVLLYRDGGASGSGCSVSGTTSGEILFSTGTACAGDANLTWNTTTKSLVTTGNGTTSQTAICGDNGGGLPGCISGLSIDEIGNQVTIGDNQAGGVTSITGGAIIALGSPSITEQVGSAAPVTPGSVTQRSVTGTTDTILNTDRENRVVYNSTSAVAVSLPTQGSTGFAGGMNFRLSNQNTGTVTVTPATGMINGNATLVLLEGQDCFVTPSSTGTNWAADCNEPQTTAGTGISITRAVHGITIAATGITLPQAVAGTVNSGGIPYFNSTTQMSSSAAGSANALMKWGGAGNPPLAAAISDNGTTITVTENMNNTGNYIINNNVILGNAGSGIFSFFGSGFAVPSRMTFGSDTTADAALCVNGTGLLLGQGGANCTTRTALGVSALSVGSLTPSAATGALSVPQQVGFVSCTQANCASTATTLFTVGANSALFRVDAAAACTASSAAATAVVAVNYTDPSGTAQTLTVPTATCTTLGASSVSQLSQSFNAENGTTIQYKVTAVSTPSYQARIAVFQESLQ